jgi:uridine kinase
VRYRRGRDSARGYYDDAYDFAALADRVLRPLGSGPPFEFATAVHDLASDELVTGATAVAEPDSIVVFDCTFLQRGSLRGLWDAVVWLDCDRAAALRRGVVRDAAALGGEEAAAAAYESRYMAACELYLEQERPFDHASIVVDNTVPLSPRLVRL